MSAAPLVSIVTPFFKAEAFLAQTINSVQAQSFKDWELLLIDDASPDRSGEIAAAAALEDPRLRLFTLAQNSGPAAARNLGLRHARGRYLCFLDADDLWQPEKLERQVAFIEETKAAVTYCMSQRGNADFSRLGRPLPVPDKLTYRSLLQNTAIVNSSSMVDLSQTGPLKLDESGFYDDYRLWLTLAKQGLGFRGLNLPLVLYRVVGGSTSSRKGRAARDVWSILRKREQLALPQALWCFFNYACRALWKRMAY